MFFVYLYSLGSLVFLLYAIVNSINREWLPAIFFLLFSAYWEWQADKKLASIFRVQLEEARARTRQATESQQIIPSNEYTANLSHSEPPINIVVPLRRTLH